jgi:hypothetical protein
MKRPPMTLHEVLRELRTQRRIYRAQIKQPVAPLDAVTREHIRYSIEALTFAILELKPKA